MSDFYNNVMAEMIPPLLNPMLLWYQCCAQKSFFYYLSILYKRSVVVINLIFVLVIFCDKAYNSAVTMWLKALSICQFLIYGPKSGFDLKANSGVRKSVGREAYYAQTGIYVWCKYNSDIKASKSFKLN